MPTNNAEFVLDNVFNVKDKVRTAPHNKPG